MEKSQPQIGQACGWIFWILWGTVLLTIVNLVNSYTCSTNCDEVGVNPTTSGALTSDFFKPDLSSINPVLDSTPPRYPGADVLNIIIRDHQ